jgi:hypothetical protein
MKRAEVMAEIAVKSNLDPFNKNIEQVFPNR